MASHPSINREMREEIIFFVFFKTLAPSLSLLCRHVVLFSFHKMKGKEREEDEEVVIKLSLLGSLAGASYLLP